MPAATATPTCSPSPQSPHPALRVYLCRCGRVHIESRHARLTLTVDAFRARVGAAEAARLLAGPARTPRPALRLVGATG